MSIFLVDEYKDMEPYVPGEQPKDKPYIKLNANETSMPPSPKVFEAISKAEIWNMSYYADPHCHEFRTAVAEVYGVTEDEVFVGNGADEVLSFVLMSFFRRGMKIYFPDITYGFYRTYAKTYGLDMEEIPVKDDFSIDINLSKLQSACLPVQCCHPHCQYQKVSMCCIYCHSLLLLSHFSVCIRNFFCTLVYLFIIFRMCF